jgi:hypothetical protein
MRYFYFDTASRHLEMTQLDNNLFSFTLLHNILPRVYTTRLNEAHILFAQERHREAVQRCRQARDVLLGEDKPTWAERVLAPIILAEKAAMIDESIKALNRMGNVASHGAGIEVDRDSANYVIGSLTLILDYIGRKLR